MEFRIFQSCFCPHGKMQAKCNSMAVFLPVWMPIYHSIGILLTILSGHPPYFRPRLWHRSFRVVLLLDALGVCLISLLMFMPTINHPCSLLVLASSPSNDTRNTSPKRTATDLIMQVLNAAF